MSTSSPRPVASVPERVRVVLAREWGVDGDVERLGGTGETYRVQTRDGRLFVCKIAGADEPAEVVALQHRAVEAAAAACPEMGWPRTRPTQAGALEAVVSDPEADTPARARVLEFVPGTPWGLSGPASDDRRRQLGRLLGDLDQALAKVDPVGARTHDWDLTQAGRHRSKTTLVADAGRRAALERAFLWHAAAVAIAADLPRQVIHGDANDENVIVHGDRVCGIVDFGDCVVAPAVVDLAIALAYALLDEDDPIAAGAVIVGAYHARRPLGVTELAVLFPLLCGRLAVTVAMAAAHRLLDADHPTWFVTEDRAWRLIERLTALDPADAGSALAAATGVDPFEDRGPSAAVVLARRRAHVSDALSVAYRAPLKMVRGRGQFLFDDRGRPFLDFVNNICHVGHCHPRVVAAGQAQMARLNTNTRYLSDRLVEYAERLCATLPAPLDTCVFVNSGSEANELALRIAATVTGRRDVIVVEGAYHGNTRGLIAVSPYKFMGPGGTGVAEPWVHVVPLPDGYRGRHRGADRDTGLAYANGVREVIARMPAPPSAFLTESLQSCGGQIVPPPGYLAAAFDHVRAAGGLCIADEVQTGFGRVGRRFWAFELQDVVPDIVVIGKPMGNGHPMGAVVTTRAIADAFSNGMEFFSSFGGNPVSCAIGLAVLDVIRDEALQAHAQQMGDRLMHGLRGLMPRHPAIGDVRGEGLFVGIELVRDRATREPWAEAADDLVNRMQLRGVLLSTDGPQHNVIKIKPPLVIQAEDVDMVLRLIDQELP